MTTRRRGQEQAAKVQPPERPSTPPTVTVTPCGHHECVDAPPGVVTIQPGQRILLVYKRTLTMAQAHNIKQCLADLYPDVQFHIADQVQNVVVLPPEETG